MRNVINMFYVKYDDFKNLCSGNSHLNHIVLNLIAILEGSIVKINSGHLWEQIKPKFLENAGTLDAYFNLLHRFPEYREAEMTEDEGFFPDVSSTGNNGLENYILESKRRLEC